MNLIERLELVLDESRKNDDLALNLLVKAGVDKTIAPEVLKALGAITVDGGDNSKRVVDLSKNGKDIIPLAVWMGSVWDANDTLELNINKVADQVHRKGAMPALENVDFTTIMTNNGGEEGKLDTLDKLTQWLDKQGAKTKNVSKGGSGYNFPKEMLAYSDDVVDCYRADTPTEAMMLGSGYPFCISRRDGSNFFYSYRINPTTTTVYFCWFKDKNGNKSHDDMVVVHVGDDGKYMVTLAKNGSFPRDSKAVTIEKYPRLKGAIESGKLTVIPMSDMEKDVRERYDAYSFVYRANIEGKSPEYIELVLAQGVKLSNEAFDYIFEEIDKGNLRKGNKGNSLTKKYVETGIHRLTPHQKEVLADAGYENEVARAVDVYVRGRLEVGYDVEPEVFHDVFRLIDKGDITKEDSLGWKILDSDVNKCRGRNLLKYSVPKESGDSYKLYSAYVFASNSARMSGFQAHCNLEAGKVVVKVENAGSTALLITDTYGMNESEYRVYYDGINSISVIKGYRTLDISRFDMSKVERIPLIEGLDTAQFDAVKNFDCKKLTNTYIDSIIVQDIVESMDFSGVSGLRLQIFGSSVESEKYYILAPNKVQALASRHFVNEKTLSSLPRSMINLRLELEQNFTLRGIPDELGFLELDLWSVGSIKRIDAFPKKIKNYLLLQCSESRSENPYPFKLSYDQIPHCIKDCDVNNMELDGNLSRYVPDGLARLTVEKDTKKKLFGSWSNVRNKQVVDGKLVVEMKDEMKWRAHNYDEIPDVIKFNILHANGVPPWIGRLKVEYTDKLDYLPERVEFIGKAVGDTKSEIRVDIAFSYREVLELTHDVVGVDTLDMYKCWWLKEIRGIEHFKGLKQVNVEKCPMLDVEGLKSQLPGVEFNLYESLQVGNLGRVLGALDEDDIGMAVPATGSGSGTVGNGTVADAGKVPTPSMGLIKADWFKDKKKRKGLRALMSSLNKLS